MTNIRGREKNIRIMGIHIAGANTHRTAIVRATLVTESLCTGLPLGPAHESVAAGLRASFPQFPVFPRDDETRARPDSGDGARPLFWEAFSADIGASPYRDSDSRLMEAIHDLGGADVFCLDAPLSLPPCVTCSLRCPGTFKCVVPEVVRMRELWEKHRKEEKRLRAPQPYVERFFEHYARAALEHPGLSGAFEYEAALSSNRSPLTARAIRMARELKSRFPEALVIESNSFLSTLGWGLKVGTTIPSLVEFKDEGKGRVMRAALLKRLEQQRLATRSASLHEELFHELYRQIELFLAAMTALSAASFLTGDALMAPEFLEVGPDSPLIGWACLPREVEQHAWKL